MILLALIENIDIEPYLSVLDTNYALPLNKIVIEEVEAFNDKEGYYKIYYIIVFDGFIISDINIPSVISV